MRKFLFAVLTAAVALSNLGFAAAQTGPSGPQTPPTPTIPATPAVNGISETEVLNYLRTLDPNVKMEKIQNGKVTKFTLNLTRDGWRYELALLLNDNILEIQATLGNPIANIQSVPAQALAQLLQANLKMFSVFCLAPRDGGRLALILDYCVSRRSLTTTSLNNVLERFCKDVRDTYPTWNAVLSASK